MASIVEMAWERGEFVTGDDGYLIYWPNEGNHGALTARCLRELADELDRRNKAWDEYVEMAMGGPSD